MKQPKAEARRWLAQAESDLAFAELGREGAQQLDQYYVPTRYPNGLPGGVPAEVFTRRQAEEAVAIARRMVAVAHAAIG